MKQRLLPTKDGTLLLEFINNSVSPEERANKITKISDSCMVTRQVVYNWMFGKSRIPALCKAKIEEVFGLQIFFEFQNV